MPEEPETCANSLWVVPQYRMTASLENTIAIFHPDEPNSNFENSRRVTSCHAGNIRLICKLVRIHFKII